MSRLILLSALTAAMAAPVARGNDPYPVAAGVLEGDVVVGVGTVTRIDNIVVNSSGAFLVEVDTNNADTTADGALLNGSGLVLREGGALALPVGASLGSFDAVTLNDAGSGGFNYFLDGTTGNNDDSGVYLDGTLLIQESDVTTAAGVSAGTPWIGFFDVKINASDDLLVLGSLDDPAIASSVDRMLVVATTTAGVLTAETVVAKEGDLLAGQVETVANIQTGTHSTAYNDAGQAMFIADLNGSTAVDLVVYRDSTIIAQEGSASPVAARNWSSLSSAVLDLNNSGDWIVRGSLDGDSASNVLVEVNGQKFVQEGDSLPAFTPFALTSFGTGPVFIADNGTTLWYGDWNDPDTSRDTGLFLNDLLVVQEGVTRAAGSTITNVRSGQDAFHLSDDGSWMIFEAELADGREGAFLIEIGSAPPTPWTDLGGGTAGALDQPLFYASGSLAADSTLRLSLSNTQPNALFLMWITLSSAPFNAVGGTLYTFPADASFILSTNASGSFSLSAPVAAGAPSGVDIWFQNIVQDATNIHGITLSNCERGTTP